MYGKRYGRHGNPLISLMVLLFFLMFTTFCSKKERTSRGSISILPDREEFIIREKEEEKNGSSDSRGNKKLPGEKNPLS